MNSWPWYLQTFLICCLPVSLDTPSTIHNHILSFESFHSSNKLNIHWITTMFRALFLVLRICARRSSFCPKRGLEFNRERQIPRNCYSSWTKSTCSLQWVHERHCWVCHVLHLPPALARRLAHFHGSPAADYLNLFTHVFFCSSNFFFNHPLLILRNSFQVSPSRTLWPTPQPA